MRKIDFVFLQVIIIFSSQLLFSQIGVNNLDIESSVNLDVKGSVRLRSLEISDNQGSFLVADDKGNLAKMQPVVNQYQNTDMHFATMSRYVITSGSSSQLDLGLSVSVLLKANTSATVFIDYSVPVIQKNSRYENTFPNSVGTNLYKHSTDVNVNDNQLSQADCTFMPTLRYAYKESGLEIYTNASVLTGTAIDIITNPYSYDITYTVKGFISSGGSYTNTYFGGISSYLPSNSDYGRGILIANIYTQ